MENFMHFNFNIEKIVIACFVTSATAKPNHRNRPSHGLAFHTSGEKTIHFHGYEPMLMHKNDIVYMPKRSNYDVTIQSPGDCYAINFDFLGTETFEPFVFHVKNAASFLECFKKANTVWNRQTPGAEMKCKAALYNIIYEMQQEFSSEYMTNEKYQIISPAMDLIHKQYDQEPLSIANLASVCSVSPEYFRRIFKNYTGSSPLAYINHLRISKAKNLLTSGLHTVTEAAIMSGYSDMSHFSREFKKATGCSPSGYIKSKK